MMPPAVMLSDDPDGRLDDNLNPHLDRLGTIRIGDREVPFLAERHERDGAVIWLISSSTLEGLPDLVREAQPFNIDVLLPPVLLSTTWQGVSIGHWVAILVLGALSYLLSYVLVFVGVQIFRLALRQRLTGFSEGVLNAFVLPARIYLAVWLLVLAVRYLGIAIVARQYFGAVLIVVTWAASLLLVWRLISLLSDLAHRQLLKHHNLGAMSALQFFRRAAKIVVLVVGVVIVLDTLGYNVTTGLAALGIGGLAVALGAQKTIENLVGSLTLIFDQPIRVGDYCSVGETSGVVEQIGMRSSRRWRPSPLPPKMGRFLDADDGNNMTTSPLIVALDYQDLGACMDLVNKLDPQRVRLKVGNELFTYGGPQVVEQLQDKGFQVFLDLKYHDIPNTVARAVGAAARLGVWMVNIHAAGGERMMVAAREAVDQATHKPLLIGVTVLTSMTAADLQQAGVSREPLEQVRELATLAQQCGLDGVVCSAQEAPMLRKVLGSKFALVTPGIRPAGAASDDQRRTLTPAEALAAGSDYLVVGRPITQAADPAQACEDLLQSLQAKDL